MSNSIHELYLTTDSLRKSRYEDGTEYLSYEVCKGKLMAEAVGFADNRHPLPADSGGFDNVGRKIPGNRHQRLCIK